MDKQYRHIFFDLDRTIWHFDENSKKVLTDIFTAYSIEKYVESPDIFIKKYQEINDSLWGLYRDNKVSKDELRWKRFSDTLLFFGINSRELGEEIGNYYVYHSPRQTMLFPYTKEVLQYLSAKYELHIITNGFQEVQHIKLDHSGITHFFNQVIMSENVGVKKPHPYIFKKALELSGAEVGESIMIGDDLYADIYGAQRMNMDHIYFNHYNKGHNKSVQKEITCLSELYDLL